DVLRLPVHVGAVGQGDSGLRDLVRDGHACSARGRYAGSRVMMLGRARRPAGGPIPRGRSGSVVVGGPPSLDNLLCGAGRKLEGGLRSGGRYQLEVELEDLDVDVRRDALRLVGDADL